jgi:tetratricopeptide (TPR) repeat protein
MAWKGRVVDVIASAEEGVALGEMLLQAVAHERNRRYDQAEPLVHRLLAADPDNPEALNLMATIALLRGEFSCAQDCILRAIEQRPETAAFHRASIEIHRRMALFDSALAAGERALAFDPTDHVVHSMIAAVHMGRLDLARCIASAREALLWKPDFAEAHFELATALLLQGEFATGWAEYEYRFGLVNGPRLPPTPRPLWQGEKMPQRQLMLVCDQGFGDAVQFARFIPWVVQRCANIAVAADREVVDIVEQMHPGVRIMHRWSPDGPFAAVCPLSSLPRLYGATAENLPPAPYLRADPARVEAWRGRLHGVCPPGRRRIGIAWAGRPTHHNDFARSIQLATLAPLADLDDIVLVSLQKGPAQAQVGGYRGAAPLLDLGHAIADFADTMAIIANLDLVVTVDTAVAHLAGAMGCPVWIMLPYLPDWRWLLDRCDSPWYPSARLFRQPDPLAWDKVVCRIVQALAQMR